MSMKGKCAPGKCPVCDHPQAYFEIAGRKLLIISFFYLLNRLRSRACRIPLFIQASYRTFIIDVADSLHIPD